MDARRRTWFDRKHLARAGGGVLLLVVAAAVARPAILANGWFLRHSSIDSQALKPARDALARGDYSQAESELRPLAVAAPASEAALELGLLHLYLGRKGPARDTLNAVLNRAEVSSSAFDLYLAARAARALGEFRRANALFRRAAEAEPTNAAIHTAWGQLFLEKHNLREAVTSFQTALRQDSKWAPAHLGLARALIDENARMAKASVQQALSIDNTLMGAHVLLAELALDQGRHDEATRAVDEALRINPRSLEALALRGARAYLDDRRSDFETDVKRVLAINPTHGEVYRMAGDHAARNYRFEEAVSLVRKALALDPNLVRAHADLGMHLMRTGDENGARKALDVAFEADPFDFVTYNLLTLLDLLQKFDTIEEGVLVVKLHPEESAVLREYVLPLAREALRTLSTRYNVTPQGPIIIEIFPRHDDFAVRNVGLPGMIGALGACFGRVVTMDSPRARPPGTFNWQATLWHELAHVVTLQLSNQRVPRWLTEGISVYEEKRARPEWGREMEINFAQALEKGETLPLRDLNSGFTDPSTISLAYFQASLLVEHIVAAYGEGALRKLLVAFGQGLDTEAALKEALQTDFDRLQASFDTSLTPRYAALRAALRGPTLNDGHTVHSLRDLAAKHQGSFEVQLALGRALRAAGDADGAIQALTRAAELIPEATGENSPLAVLAEIHLERGDRPRAIAALDALVTRDHLDVKSARKLATLLTEQGVAPTRLQPVYGRIVGLDPFDGSAHRLLGQAARQTGDVDTAVREFRAALATGVADRAGTHFNLAESYLAAGNRTEARRQVLAALEIAPSYEPAQELLLKIQGIPR